MTHTIGSITDNILAPARILGEVRIFAHFFRQATINNPRSGENGALNPDEHALLAPDWLELEAPEHCLEIHRFEEIKAFGDEWQDEFRSLSNLIHQLHSLKRVTEAALKWAPDIYIFVRPDLEYHDSFAPLLTEVSLSGGDSAWYPNWQLCGGLNDRFLICRGDNVAHAYGARIDVALDFCRKTGNPLRSEKLVAHALKNRGVTVRPMPLRASRVRANGKLHPEKFDHPALNRAKCLIIMPFRMLGLWSIMRRSKVR